MATQANNVPPWLRGVPDRIPLYKIPRDKILHKNFPILKKGTKSPIFNLRKKGTKSPMDKIPQDRIPQEKIPNPKFGIKTIFNNKKKLKYTFI